MQMHKKQSHTMDRGTEARQKRTTTTKEQIADNEIRQKGRYPKTVQHHLHSDTTHIHAKSNTCPSNGGAGGSDIWIRAMVDVQQGPIRT